MENEDGMPQKKARLDKVTKLFDYIHFDWGDERPGKKSDWKIGAKKWQIYKEFHGWTDISEDQRQLMKRINFFLSTHIFDKDFTLV
jgi:hypothetical protein